MCGFQTLTIMSPVRHTKKAIAIETAAASGAGAVCASDHTITATAATLMISAPYCIPTVCRHLRQYHGASK